jgi:hypothetical protein
MSLEDTQGSSYTDSQDVQTPDLNTNTETFNESSNDFSSQDNFEKDFHMDDNDKELYENVLEKLDIKRKEKKHDIQENSVQDQLKNKDYLDKIKNLDNSQQKNQLEKILSQDFAKIQKLVKSGLINSAQGQNLKKEVLKKAFDKLVQTEKIKRALYSGQKPKKTGNSLNASQVLEDFSKNNPSFFNSGGRKEVLNYLKSGGVTLGKDELGKISELVRFVEKTAIDRYLQKTAHEKNLRNSNESAKQKLTANAQKSGFSGNLSRTFTREQIGKMSTAQFAKYEPAIMEQLRKGLIR